MLRLEGVSKKYTHRRSNVSAINEASFVCGEGEFVSVVGQSGSGKSTLLLLMGGMLSPTTGKVLVEDVSLYDLSVEDRAAFRRKNIGFVFQTFNLVPYLTAVENVQIPLLLAGVDEKTQLGTAENLLDRVGLGNRMDHKPSELSVGQQQRVALARMLANGPKIILADEPTGNLDPQTRDEIVEFLGELNAEGKTVILVTHDPQVAERTSRTLKLVEGRILFEEEPVSACCAI
jgi:putative ABC transport system ATP-binding protein